MDIWETSALFARLAEIEKVQTLEDFVILSTCGQFVHKMEIEADYLAFSDMKEVYDDLKAWEIVELLDAQNLGRLNGDF